MRRLGLLIVLPFLLAGCDIYDSGVPLDEPTALSFDDSLLGTWVVVDDDMGGDEAPVLEIRRFNEREYLLEWSERAVDPAGAPAEPVSAQDRARGYVTVIDDSRILNVQDLDEGTFTFARYAIAGSTLRFRMIASGPDERGLKEQFSTSAELRAAVRARLHDPLLYDEEETVAHRVPRVAGP
jgi:hypothetical protein